MDVDWFGLAKQVKEQGCELYGTRAAEIALEILIGRAAIIAAVEYCIDNEPECDLTRSVLQFLRLPLAMEHCYSIYSTDDDVQRRQEAVCLFVSIGDQRTLPWIAEFLQDADLQIQGWGAYLLEQLVWRRSVSPCGEISSELSELLQIGETHDNEHVRSYFVTVREYITKRQADVNNGGVEEPLNAADLAQSPEMAAFLESVEEEQDAGELQRRTFGFVQSQVEKLRVEQEDVGE